MKLTQRLLVLLLTVLTVLTAQGITRFFDSDRLSSNLITSLAQDHKGYIWVGTEYGLNRFDGVRFAQYYADDPVAHPLRDNNVRSLLTDREGRLWVQLADGIQRHDEQTGDFIHVAFDSQEVLTMACIMQRRDGTLLVLTASKGIWRIDPKTMKATPDEPLNKAGLTTDAHTLIEDTKGRLWIATNDNGLTMIDPKGRSHRFGEEVLGSRGLSGIGQDGLGRVVVLSRTQLLLYNEKQQQLEPLMPVDKALSARRMFSSPQGDLYIGTFGHGLLRIDLDKMELITTEERMPVVPRPASTYQGLPDMNSQKVNAMLVDALQNIWIGCFQQGLAFISPRQYPFVFQRMSDYSFDNGGHLTALFGDNKGNVYVCQEKNGVRRAGWAGRLEGTWLEGKTVISGKADSDNHLWIGTYNSGACRLNLETSQAQWLPQLNGERIKSFTFDRQGNVYMAVFFKGLRSFTADGSRERTLGSGQLKLHNLYINQLMTDSKGVIWIGHYYGLDLYDPQKDRLVELPQDSLLRCATIYALVEGKDGIVWVGTNHGLWGYDRRQQSWQHYDKRDGLPNEIICGIVEDQKGTLWLSTYRGLSHLDRKTTTFTNYFKGNGLVESSYARGIYFTSPLGHVNLGTDNGITYFFPKDVHSAEFLREPALTGLVVNGVNHPAADGRVELPYTDNTFTLHFSTMDFRSPDNVVYEYRFSDEPHDVWHQSELGEGSLTFTHLSPGRHQLEVRAVDNGLRSPLASFSIRITPPWYRTWWAYTLLLMIVAGIALMLWLNWWHKQKADTNEEKIKFFVDVSHELRSPLTLIKSPLDTLLRQQHDPQTQRALRNISRNTDRLLSLVNEILSIRKIEKGQMHLHYAETPLGDFVAAICHNYDYQAEKRKITLSMHSEDDGLTAWIDRENFDKVVNNLLTNAMKYVENGGSIDVSVRPSHDEKGREVAELAVRDNGTGIDEEQLRHVFERFYQASARPQSGQMGYGIGLNLAYKVVRLHGGTIEAHNRTDVEHGSEFVVRLPLGSAHLPKELLVEADYFANHTGQQVQPMVADQENQRAVRKRTSYKVVVVDDDEEIRNFLTTELGYTYHVTAYANGKLALEAISNSVPDLVISDVVMPVMDGIELLHRIKNNTKISHVPVILLTTKTELQSRVEGLEQGADAYIDKPFNLEELEACATGLIANRQRMKGKFSGTQEQEGAMKQLVLKGNDEMLMERIMKCINERLSDEDFNVEALADEVGLSRVQLHRRVKEMTGITVGEFIRNLRMQQAAKILEKGDVTVSQVTYAIGMVNPTHFTTTFKRYFGITPTEYMNKHAAQKE